MNRRPGACRYKYCGGEKDGNYKISWEHVGLSTRIASSYLPFGELGDKRSANWVQHTSGLRSRSRLSEDQLLFILALRCTSTFFVLADFSRAC
jgi:hypothetical protein